MLPGSASPLPIRVLCPSGLCLSFFIWIHSAIGQPRRGQRRESFCLPRPLRTHLAGGSAPGLGTTVKQAPRTARGAARGPAFKIKLATAKLEPSKPSLERRLPGPRRKPEHLGDGTAGSRKRPGRSRLAAAKAAGAVGAARQGSRGTRLAPEPGAPSGAEPRPRAGRAAREVSTSRSWGAVGAGGRRLQRPARAREAAGVARAGGVRA